MFFLKSMNFHSYLFDYEFFKEYFPNQTRKHFKTTLMVLYGKKKDRSHIKAKYEKATNEWFKKKPLLYKAVAQHFPIIRNYL